MTFKHWAGVLLSAALAASQETFIEQQQLALDKIAEQFRNDGFPSCTVPQLATCGESSCSGSWCGGFEIGFTTAKEVTSLSLRSSALTSLPTEIGSLTALTYLSLYSNRLTSLPPEIGSLTALTDLCLDYNYLTILPKEFASLTKLTYDSYSNAQYNYLNCTYITQFFPPQLSTDYCGSQNTCSDETTCSTPCADENGLCTIQCGPGTYRVGEYCQHCPGTAYIHEGKCVEISHCKAGTPGQSTPLCTECDPGFGIPACEPCTGNEYSDGNTKCNTIDNCNTAVNNISTPECTECEDGYELTAENQCRIKSEPQYDEGTTYKYATMTIMLLLIINLIF